jgi:hypothetical protein
MSETYDVTALDPVRVREALSWLASSQPAIFGVNGHHFLLNPPRPETDVSAFEQRHRIRLPSEYRHFITQIGDGGAGPYYGIFPLGFIDGTSGELHQWEEGDGFIGVLSTPFPLHGAWNDLSGMPPKDLLDTNEEAYERQLDAFEERYWDASRLDGAIPLCHQGCALRVWLIVTGSEVGHLWSDGRADNSGLAPMELKDGSRATFSSWYREWLEEALQAPAVDR